MGIAFLVPPFASGFEEDFCTKPVPLILFNKFSLICLREDQESDDDSLASNDAMSEVEGLSDAEQAWDHEQLASASSTRDDTSDAWQLVVAPLFKQKVPLKPQS